ncbi:MAG: hypothetical protein M0P58_09075 [Bacteroidales bacterium]|nr:hypothetical protein [Bacteroidales bacterium]
MKTKTTILFVLIILAVAGIIVLISTISKPSRTDLQSGTIVKAEKYRRSSMTEKDILLRSEFMKDTTQLRSMIQGINYFGQFNEKIVVQINASIKEFQNHPILIDQSFNRPFIGLQDYCLFLTNNNESLKSTEAMLVQFRSGQDQADQSIDVEKNLRDFGNYITQVAERDTILEQAAMTIDRYLEKKGKKQILAEEVNDLKKFRDQLLVDNLMTAAMLGEKGTLKRLSNYAKRVNPQIDLISATGELNMNSSLLNIKSQADLNFVSGMQALQNQLQGAVLK